jgi:hypothetical protein
MLQPKIKVVMRLKLLPVLLAQRLYEKIGFAKEEFFNYEIVI